MLNLSDFQKPQRYIGNEWNVIKKDHSGKIKIALCFPDLYEVAMSNVGLRILYGLLNSFEDVVCERVFMPDIDLYRHLKKNNIKLFSLETKTPIDQFDVVGVNLNCELNFTNFLGILSSSQIDLFSKDRKEIIVLGSCLSNMEAVADFVDLFFLGEFEDGVSDFLSVIRKIKQKKQRLEALSQIDGFYVPSFYMPKEEGNQYRLEKKKKSAKYPLKTRYVKDLNNSFVPTKWLVPYTNIVHDRVQVEISRGCPNICSFCQARSIYYPYRERSVEKILEIIKETYDNTGYENFSFLSLSASNYSNIERVVEEVSSYCKPLRIGVSLPSLRVEDAVGKLYQSLSKIKKLSATFAVEAATKDLRKSINKNINIDALFEVAKLMKSLGAKHLKLYFMFGFPGEADNDLLEIGNFVNKLHNYSRLNINLSINAFIPKPFSCLQNVCMQPKVELERKKKVILSNLPKRRWLKISISNIRRSILEAVLSRGNRDLSKVIFNAFLNGALFDGYDDRVDYNLWEQAFIGCGLEANQYLSVESCKYWQHIESFDPLLNRE